MKHSRDFLIIGVTGMLVTLFFTSLFIFFDISGSTVWALYPVWIVFLTLGLTTKKKK